MICLNSTQHYVSTARRNLKDRKQLALTGSIVEGLHDIIIALLKGTVSREELIEFLCIKDLEKTKFFNSMITFEEKKI